MRDGRQPEGYLMMHDDRVHTAEGGAERGEPIGGLLRDIEEHIRGFHNHFPLCWEPQSRQ